MAIIASQTHIIITCKADHYGGRDWKERERWKEREKESEREREMERGKVKNANLLCDGLPVWHVLCVRETQSLWLLRAPRGR